MNNTKDKNEKLVCRCEEVTEEEVRQCIAEGCETLREIKMVTRTGMGLCQGRTCSKIISRILAEEIGKPLDEIEPAGYRPPLRLITLGTLANKQLKKL
jgi:NAD(P)H-nitrite reductase large subunit